MSQLADVRPESAPPPSEGSRRLLRWVCTSNPFYVLSALLVLLVLFAACLATGLLLDSMLLQTLGVSSLVLLCVVVLGGLTSLTDRAVAYQATPAATPQAEGETYTDPTGSFSVPS